MVASRCPKLEQQQASTGRCSQRRRDGAVTFRTLDIGGDKILPYMAT
jgi:phosphotransferase system, enzyme I, PtsP